MARRLRAAFGALLLMCTGAAFVVPTIASAAPPYSCQDSNWNPVQTWVSQTAYVDGVVGELGVGTQDECTGTDGDHGYIQTVWLENHDATQDGTYMIVQAGFWRIEATDTCSSGDCWLYNRASHSNECHYQYGDGIRYAIRLEVWNSSHNYVYADCWDYGSSSGSDFKAKITDANCGFYIYMDKNDDGDYTDAGDVDGAQLGTSLSYDAVCGGGGLKAGVYDPEQFDRGETNGTSGFKADAYDLRYEQGTTWYSFVLGTCNKPSGSSPTITCSVGTGNDNIHEYGT